VTSPTTYDWFGRPSPRISRAVRAALTPAEAESFLVGRIAGELYRSWYVRGHSVRRDLEGAAWHEDPDAEFVRTLSQANSGRGGWERGWRVAERDGERLVLARGRLRVRAKPADCRPPGDVAGAGERVSVRRPKELRNISPGHYLALGDAERPPGRQSTELRVYLHVRPAGAATLVAAATGACNAEAIPFSLKVLADPASFTRCDAAVLYLDDADFERARGPLRAIVDACGDDLDDPPPPFSKRLARGVGLGEHDGNRDASFGTSRCRLVAQGVVAHARVGGEVLEAVAASFGAAGLDLDRPYLVSASRDDDYAL
jgi:hypothetical protein